MKKFILLFSVLLLMSGCESLQEENDANLENGTPAKEVTNNAGEYVVGDRIISMYVIDGGSKDYRVYYFGGFIDDDTFVINMHQSGSGGFSPSYPFYYTIEENMQFLLPASNTLIKLEKYDVQNNTISITK